MNLEKFCIVKRRKQGLDHPYPSFLSFPMDEPDPLPAPSPPTQASVNGEEGVLAIPLTAAQSRAVREGGILSVLEGETPKSFQVDVERGENGSVVFHFHLQNHMMLNPVQVCRMMQISRSLLNRMILEKKIKSYKIGRLRRFFLNDILENLKQQQTENTLDINIEVC
jgi:excisionase family DNA binding protein